MKILKGVAHDIAHYAQSGLACVDPHLGKLCRAESLTLVSLELLAPQPYPPGLLHIQPLELALRALQAKFYDMLVSRAIPASAVASIHLEFLYDPPGEDYSRSICATITSSDGRVFTKQAKREWLLPAPGKAEAD